MANGAPTANAAPSTPVRYSHDEIIFFATASNLDDSEAEKFPTSNGRGFLGFLANFRLSRMRSIACDVVPRMI